MRLGIVVVLVIVGKFGFRIGGNSLFYTFYGGLQLIARNDAALWKRIGVRLACSLEYGQGVFGKHQQFGGCFRVKDRSEERRGGEESDSKCRYRGAADTYNNKQKTYNQRTKE